MPFSTPKFSRDRGDDAGDIPRGGDDGSPGDLPTVFDVVQQLRDDGHLDAGAKIDVAGKLHPVTRAEQSGRQEDGQEVTFPSAYGDVPSAEVTPASGGYFYEPADGNGNFGSDTRQYGVTKPDALDNQGMTVIAEIQDRGATTQTTDSYDTTTSDTPLTAQGEAWSLANKDETENGGDGLSGVAADDTYLNVFSYTVQVSDTGGQFDVSSVTVTIATDKWDADQGSWVEVGEVQVSASASGGGSSTNSGSDSTEFTHSGFDTATSDDVRTRIKEIDQNCGSGGCTSTVSVTPDQVEYSEATVVPQTMSADGEKHNWVARAALS